MKKALQILLILVALSPLLFFLGPKPASTYYGESLPHVNVDLWSLEDSLRTSEEGVGAMECAMAEVHWADSIRKTPYVLLYLHGFSATQHEGDPLRYELAKEFDMNAFYPRMAGHGLEEEDPVRMLKFTAQQAWNKALYDFNVAKALGHKVVLVSCSTGSLLALRLAATFPEDVAAVMNYSPNMGLPDPSTELLNGPWGLQLVKAISGTEYRIVDARADGKSEPCKPKAYSWESVVEMQQLVETAATDEVLQQVQCPVLNMVWYEDEENQDPVIDVAKARVMHEKLATEDKVWVETAAKEHVILNDLISQDYETVRDASIEFLTERL